MVDPRRVCNPLERCEIPSSDRGSQRGRGLLTPDFWGQKTPKPRYRFLIQMMFQRSEGTMERRPFFV
jgi:hypothetical protein